MSLEFYENVHLRHKQINHGKFLSRNLHDQNNIYIYDYEITYYNYINLCFMVDEPLPKKKTMEEE